MPRGRGGSSAPRQCSLQERWGATATALEPASAGDWRAYCVPNAPIAVLRRVIPDSLAQGGRYINGHGARMVSALADFQLLAEAVLAEHEARIVGPTGRARDRIQAASPGSRNSAQHAARTQTSVSAPVIPAYRRQVASGRGHLHVANEESNDDTEGPRGDAASDLNRPPTTSPYPGYKPTTASPGHQALPWSLAPFYFNCMTGSALR